jgi:RNA polymerase subunit RPABC4/transcription elongation factor Spt4
MEIKIRVQHHFCEGCIMECVNRKHVCPCCNADATKAQLVRNHWFDKMLAIVQQEKEDAAKKYFSKLVASSGASLSASFSPSIHEFK